MARLLDEREGRHEAQADANKDGVGQLPAGALHHGRVVVLDEDACGDDGDNET